MQIAGGDVGIMRLTWGGNGFAGGDVDCGDIGGSLSVTGGSVSCDDVEGDVFS